MKRYFLTIVLLGICAMQLLTAQTPETPYTTPKDTAEEPLVVFRDRFVMDVYHTFWMGMPVEVQHMKFDPGVNFSAIWDFKIKKKPLAIGLGIGVSYYTQYSNALLQYDKANDLMKYYVLPEGVEYNHISMNYVSVNVPVEFRYRHPNGFKFTIGARAGWVALINQDYTIAGGIDAVVEILNSVDRGTERHILETLETEQPELADEIRKKMFVFEDILSLDDKSIQRVLRDVDNNELAIALKGSNEEVQSAIFKNMSTRLAQMIKEDMDFMGPVRMKDVEEAQQKIVNVIRKLEDSGEIVISRGGGDELVV